MDLHQLFLVVATAAGISLAAVFFYAISRQGTLNSIKSRTVGDGQHGTALIFPVSHKNPADGHQ